MRLETDNARFQSQMDIFWHRAEALGSCPDAFHQGRIVVPGQHCPRARKCFDSVEYAANGSVCDDLGVKDISCHQDRIALVLVSQAGDSFNGLKACFNQRRAVFCFEATECPPHLPVCCV